MCLPTHSVGFFSVRVLSLATVAAEKITGNAVIVVVGHARDKLE